jgi:hypothetical protein
MRQLWPLPPWLPLLLPLILLLVSVAEGSKLQLLKAKRGSRKHSQHAILSANQVTVIVDGLTTSAIDEYDLLVRYVLHVMLSILAHKVPS